MRRLDFSANLPISLPEAWKFFSDPRNLSVITPPDMNFVITSPELPDAVYPGLIITYKVSPLLHIPMDWMTEITQVRDKDFFIDEQKIGPFALWHHQHHFTKTRGGVLMKDILHYDVGFGPIGMIADRLMVHRRVQQIFRFREQKLRSLFA